MLAWSIDGVAPGWMSAVIGEIPHPDLVAAGLRCRARSGCCASIAFTHLINTLGGFLGQCVPFIGVSLAAVVFPFRRRHDFEGSSVSRKIGPASRSSRSSGCSRSLGVPAGFWRLLVDDNYGANNPLSIWFTVGVAVFGLVWFYGFKYWSKSRGVNVDRRFEEIPIE